MNRDTGTQNIERRQKRTKEHKTHHSSEN